MTPTSLANILQQRHVWRVRIDNDNGQSTRLATGWPELDQQLSGGWPRAAVTEVLVTRSGQGELGLLMPTLQRLCRSNRRILWIAPPLLPYPPALAQQGLDLSRINVVRCAQASDALWAAEQALRSGACSAVLCWSQQLDDRCFRRLQLAATAGDSWCVMFRAEQFANSGSPAALRLLISSQNQQPRVRIIKQRGGRPQPAVSVPRRLLTTC
jgi:hypothetical protein